MKDAVTVLILCAVKWWYNLDWITVDPYSSVTAFMQCEANMRDKEEEEERERNKGYGRQINQKGNWKKVRGKEKGNEIKIEDEV